MAQLCTYDVRLNYKLSARGIVALTLITWLCTSAFELAKHMFVLACKSCVNMFGVRIKIHTRMSALDLDVYN